MSTLELLKDFMADNNISQSAIARGIGRSATAVNQFLKGKYAGDIEGLEREIEAFIDLQEEKKKENRSDLPFVETPTANRILEFLQLAHLDSEMQVLYGGAGMGKSKAINAYAERNSGVIVIDVDPSYTARDVLVELSKCLKISTRGSINDLMRECVRKLKNSDRLVIVDEAELLPHRALEILRRLHDKAGVGMVLAGMDRLIINLKGKNGEYAQLYSRIGFAFNIGESLPQEDIHVITCAAHKDLSHLGDVMFRASQGNARRLSKLIKRIERMSTLNQSPPDREMVEEVAEMLIS